MLSFSFVPRWLQSLEPHTVLGQIRLVSDVLQHCEALLAQRQVQFVIAHGLAGAPGGLEAAGARSLAIGSDLLLPLHARGAPERALLGFSDESGLGRIVRQVLGAELAHAGLQPVFTAHLASVLRTMALDGRGLAWLPQSLVHEDLQARRLQVSGPAHWRIPVEIRLYRDAAPLGLHAEAFWHAAEQLAAGSRAEPPRVGK
jgi:DNA-binding transcriptional LysR family regulator